MARSSAAWWVLGAFGVVGLAMLGHAEASSPVASGRWAPPSAPLAAPWLDPSRSLGERAVLWSLAQQSLGSIETDGPNAGPRIRDYFAGATRRDQHGIERPVGIKQDYWCVAGLCYGERRCLLPGEAPLLPWRVAGFELQRDAVERALWRPAGTYHPRVGDVVVFVRPPDADPELEWRRHVCRVSVAPQPGSIEYQTIDANHGDRWGRVRRRLTDQGLLGFVEYPRMQQTQTQPVWAMQQPVGRSPASVLLVGDSLAVGLDPHLKRRAEAAGWRYVVDARGGTRTDQWARWIGQVLKAAGAVDLVAISSGGNDFVFQKAHDDRTLLPRSVAAIRAAVHGAGAELVWIEPPPIPWADTAGSMATWRSQMHAQRVFPTRAYRPQQRADKVHPTYAESRRLADALFAQLAAIRLPHPMPAAA